jgi:Big-like domain-containing protein
MLRTLRHALALRALTLVIGSAAIGACTLATDVTAPGGLIKVSGDGQTAAANTALPTPLTVAVVNQFGQTLQNVTVNWIIASGGGSLSSSAMLSDEGGLASVTYTTGPTAGQAVIKARVNGVPDLSFNIQIT